MENAVQQLDPRENTPEPESPQAVAPARKADARKLFKYSTFLHVGEGAEECEHALDGACEDEEHFHAWCRLPNAVQQEDIRKKALAAKARTIRGYKDKDADATITLDNELAQIDDPSFLDVLIDDLLARDFVDDWTEAQRDVTEATDSEFEHIVEDRERYNELGGPAIPVADMEDEHRQLHEHIGAYVEAVQARLDEIRTPKRKELAERGIDKLIRLVRAKRVEQDGDQAFIDTYNRWVWFVGTYTTEPHPKLKRPHIPVWQEIGSPERPVAGSMFAAAPEVLDELRATFNRLQLAFSEGSSGN